MDEYFYHSLGNQFEVLPFTNFTLETLDSEVREVMDILKRGHFVSLTIFIMAHGFTDEESDEAIARWVKASC